MFIENSQVPLNNLLFEQNMNLRTFEVRKAKNTAAHNNPNRIMTAITTAKINNTKLLSPSRAEQFVVLSHIYE